MGSMGLVRRRAAATGQEGAILALAAFALAAVFGFLAFRQTAVWKDGVALFANCTDKTPESSLCQCNLAYNQLISLDFQNAVYHYSEALKYDPTTIEAYNGRGQAYFQLRQVPQALDDFSKAIAAGIVTPKLFLNRGKCLVMLNRAQEAVPDLTRSLELEPRSPEAYYFRAVAQEKTGNPTAATDDYGKALDLNPNYVEALVNRGLLLFNAGKLDGAIADYSAALRIAAPNVQPMILNNRANAYLQTGKLNEALEDAGQAVRVNPKYARGYQTRAAVYTRLGQADKARQLIDATLSRQNDLANQNPAFKGKSIEVLAATDAGIARVLAPSFASDYLQSLGFRYSEDADRNPIDVGATRPIQDPNEIYRIEPDYLVVIRTDAGAGKGSLSGLPRQLSVYSGRIMAVDDPDTVAALADPGGYLAVKHLDDHFVADPFGGAPFALADAVVEAAQRRGAAQLPRVHGGSKQLERGTATWLGVPPLAHKVCTRSLLAPTVALPRSSSLPGVRKRRCRPRAASPLVARSTTIAVAPPGHGTTTRSRSAAGTSLGRSWNLYWSA